MSRSGALIRARSLRESLLDHGVRKVSIEIQTGRPGTPNSRWHDDRFIGSCGHHIVSSRSQGLTPGLGLIKHGRADVPGPLANGYGGFDLTARIICMGWANHPGAGGPHTLPGGTIPRDGARPYLFGWEFEGGIVLADWTDEVRSFMGSCHAGTLDWLGRDERSHIEHFTWAPDRKIDRLKYTLTSARAEVRANWEDDMTPAELRAELDRFFGRSAGALTYNDAPISRDMAMQRAAQWSGGNSNTLKYRVAPELAAIRAAAADDPAAVAAELAPLVIPPVVAAVGTAGGLTQEQVEEAAEKALKDFFAPLVDQP